MYKNMQVLHILAFLLATTHGKTLGHTSSVASPYQKLTEHSKLLDTIKLDSVADIPTSYELRLLELDPGFSWIHVFYDLEPNIEPEDDDDFEYLDMFKSILKDKTMQCIVLTEKGGGVPGRLAGFNIIIPMIFDPDGAEYYRVGYNEIHPRYQGKGLGKHFFSALFAAYKRRFNAPNLLVYNDVEPVAKGIYLYLAAAKSTGYKFAVLGKSTGVVLPTNGDMRLFDWAALSFVTMRFVMKRPRQSHKLFALSERGGVSSITSIDMVVLQTESEDMDALQTEFGIENWVSQALHLCGKAILVDMDGEHYPGCIMQWKAFQTCTRTNEPYALLSKAFNNLRRSGCEKVVLESSMMNDLDGQEVTKRANKGKYTEQSSDDFGVSFYSDEATPLSKVNW